MTQKYSTPLNRFDMRAGAKAAYQAFQHYYPAIGWARWESLTGPVQDHWEQVVKAGIKAAFDAKQQKERARGI